MSLFQPSNQIKLTNVAIVRYKSHGKRFEVACYKNKILNWRSGVEWDLDEVLQIRSIFTNVSKGLTAKSEDLVSVFGSNDVDKICKIILNKGEIQVSETERSYMLDKQYTDICHMLSKMTINPNNNLPLSVKIIESELKESGFSVSLNKSTKEQALKAYDLLKKRIPDQIERAKMLLKLTVDIGKKQYITEKLEKFNIYVASTEEDQTIYSITFFCEPRYYREIDMLDCKLLLLDSNIKNMDSSPELDRESLSEVHLCKQANLKTQTKSLPSTKQGVMTDNRVELLRSSPTQDGELGILERRSIQKLHTQDKKPTSKSNNMLCRKCNVELDDSITFREHYRSEWHIFNTKRNAKGMSPISEEEFNELKQDIKMGFLAVD
ncbi:ribosome maturation protein SBDS [Cryptosporidium felis]|nr:ribosome maturation protein SBDS [Cryptosporidium felis]